MHRRSDPEVDAIEMSLLLEGVFQRYGFDFRHYAPASIRRRIWNVVRDEGLSTVSGLQERVLHDTDAMERFLLALSVHVTTMFRDPAFFRALREVVVPILRTYPFLRIWNAGCSTGEEVYSVAIMLQEEGLYDRARIYATDMSEAVLRRARAGIFPLKMMQEYTTNYHAAGGKKAFSEYYTADHGHAIFRPTLRSNIIFSPHNLASDGSFNEFNMILCRNVVIYFDKELQDRVHRLFYESLVRFGVLGLGTRETVRFTAHEKDYEPLVEREKLYRRVG
jgi:chemotaxis protein methyltransferase CheR